MLSLNFFHIPPIFLAYLQLLESAFQPTPSIHWTKLKLIKIGIPKTGHVICGFCNCHTVAGKDIQTRHFPDLVLLVVEPEDDWVLLPVEGGEGRQRGEGAGVGLHISTQQQQEPRADTLSTYYLLSTIPPSLSRYVDIYLPS